VEDSGMSETGIHLKTISKGGYFVRAACNAEKGHWVSSFVFDKLLPEAKCKKCAAIRAKELKK
jgi:hypothetical protein